jgi:hypothetical protein
MTAATAVDHDSAIEASVQPFHIWGTHGTSLSRAKSIKYQGFELKPGRIGVGAYFWTAIDSSDVCLDLARRLARTWATNSGKGGQYAGDDESGLAIVEVGIEVEPDAVLPLDNPKMTFRLWSVLRSTLSEELGINSDTDWGKVNLHNHMELIHGIIEGFVVKLEAEMGSKFKVIFKSQNCPKYSDPILPFIGNHSCFAIRDASVIKNMAITN